MEAVDFSHHENPQIWKLDEILVECTTDCMPVFLKVKKKFYPVLRVANLIFISCARRPASRTILRKIQRYKKGRGKIKNLPKISAVGELRPQNRRCTRCKFAVQLPTDFKDDENLWFHDHLLRYAEQLTDFVSEIVECNETWCHEFHSASKRIRIEWQGPLTYRVERVYRY
ncbi:hypothetical protein TNCV_2127351 [Trichonephila clavipes]|nr:hypothetical protein TNCV_2127351 [Trichonephila clavipes]